MGVLEIVCISIVLLGEICSKGEIVGGVRQATA